MITTGGKLWFAVAVLGAAAGALYWLGTGRGEWFGTFVLASVVLGALLLGVTTSQLDDGDVEPGAGVLDEVPVRRTLPAAWPALGALGGGLTLVGLAGGTPLLYAGLGVIALVIIEWAIQGWAERATGDHTTNQSVRDRVMSPIEIPVAAALLIAFVVLSFSRVFLALPKNGTIIVAGVLAVAIMAIASLLAARPGISRSLVTGLMAIGAVAVLAGGIVGLTAGTREFEHPVDDEQVDDGGAEHAEEVDTTTTVKP